MRPLLTPLLTHTTLQVIVNTKVSMARAHAQCRGGDMSSLGLQRGGNLNLNEGLIAAWGTGARSASQQCAGGM